MRALAAARNVPIRPLPLQLSASIAAPLARRERLTVRYWQSLCAARLQRGKDRGCVIQNRWSRKRIARFRFVGVAVLAYFPFAARVNADPVTLQWPQPQGKGSSIAITYSY